MSLMRKRTDPDRKPYRTSRPYRTVILTLCSRCSHSRALNSIRKCGFTACYPRYRGRAVAAEIGYGPLRSISAFQRKVACLNVIPGGLWVASWKRKPQFQTTAPPVPSLAWAASRGIQRWTYFSDDARREMRRFVFVYPSSSSRMMPLRLVIRLVNHLVMWPGSSY